MNKSRSYSKTARPQISKVLLFSMTALIIVIFALYSVIYKINHDPKTFEAKHDVKGNLLRTAKTESIIPFVGKVENMPPLSAAVATTTTVSSSVTTFIDKSNLDLWFDTVIARAHASLSNQQPLTTPLESNVDSKRQEHKEVGQAAAAAKLNSKLNVSSIPLGSEIKLHTVTYASHG